MSNDKCGCSGEHDHHHDHECGCGHDHDHDHDHDHAAETITISLDGEVNVECNVLGVFEVSEREYIALLPVDDEEVMIFRYSEEDGNVELGDIETDEEYEEVAEVFYEVFMGDEEDFDDEEDNEEE